MDSHSNRHLALHRKVECSHPPGQYSSHHSTLMPMAMATLRHSDARLLQTCLSLLDPTAYRMASRNGLIREHRLRPASISSDLFQHDPILGRLARR